MERFNKQIVTGGLLNPSCSEEARIRRYFYHTRRNSDEDEFIEENKRCGDYCFNFEYFLQPADGIGGDGGVDWHMGYGGAVSGNPKQSGFTIFSQ